MAAKTKQNFLQKFLSNEKQYPVLAAVAAGLYPILFYYSNNYSLVNTWSHVGYFLLYFICIPVGLFVIVNRISKIPSVKNWQKYVLPFLNVFVFLFLLKVCLYAGIQKKITLGILIFSGLLAFFLYKYFKKLIVIQYILAMIGLVTLVPKIINQFNYSDEWMSQPDDIEHLIFKKKPNVYYIQPDGYTNFSELKKGYYNLDNSKFETFLKDEGLTYYNDFRSNYASTLSSNSATFMMKHHYYNQGANFSEAINARNVIISKNTVLDIFKNNNYKTYFLTERPYLLLNRPEMGYDICNFSYDDIAYIGIGLGERQDILTPLKKYILEDNAISKFFFIEMFNPSHIQNKNLKSKKIVNKLWIESLDQANIKLKNMVTSIKKKDPKALIIIMADHGGFVGMEYTNQIYTKTEDRDLIYSIFSSMLAIHWPNGEAPDYDSSFKTTVNVFRILFSYLSEDESYLSHLQEDGSYVVIKKGAPKGIYKYIDSEGEITLKKHGD